MVNQLCDNTLHLAASRGESVVDEPLIQQAWAKLQQIPVSDVSPTMATPTLGIVSGPTAARNIEFGVLPDENDTMNSTTTATIVPYTEEKSYTQRDEKDEEMDTGWCSFELEVPWESHGDVLDGYDDKDTELESENESEDELESKQEQELELESPQEQEQEEGDSDVRERTDHVYLARSSRAVSDVGLPKYPGYPGDGSTMLNWVGPGHQVPSGVATPYRWTYTPTETSCIPPDGTPPEKNVETIGHIGGVPSTFPATMKTPIPPQVGTVVASSLAELYDEVVPISSDVVPARYVAEMIAVSADTLPLPFVMKDENTDEDTTDSATEIDWLVKLSEFHKEIKEEIHHETAVSRCEDRVECVQSVPIPMKTARTKCAEMVAPPSVQCPVEFWSLLGGTGTAGIGQHKSATVSSRQGVNLLAALREPVKKGKEERGKGTGHTSRPVIGISLEKILSDSFASF